MADESQAASLRAIEPNRTGLLRRTAPRNDGPVTLAERILYIDAEAIVIDKPAGLPVDEPRRGGPSLTSRLDELHCGFKRLPVPMHRLDQDTSGCLLLARSPKSRARLQKAFEARQVGKFYLAVVGCEVADVEGVIDVPLGKKSSFEGGWKMVPDAEGQTATTHWRTLLTRDGRSLVEFRPVTGRTHQIRAHAREAFGCGIVGDRVYGVPGGPMLLHATRLVVPRDNHATIDVTAPLPEHFGEWRNAS
ncbi:RluA family pseudouridine synthase [Sphingomonas piscis]|uniref:RluA family pseudouridine synthase n=1 Tax=Sphingomonas piscis TaxID=2714943 RepID=UPI001FECBCE6|nr:RNA pseudouridine synthase [Sphingomonas piscis]